MSEYVDRRLNALQVDYRLVALLTVTVCFQIGAVLVAQWASGFSAEPTQTTDLSISLRLAGIVIVESLFLVGLWRLYGRLSGIWQTVVKWTLATLIIGGQLVILYALTDLAYTAKSIGIVVIALGVHHYTSGSEFVWIAFNAIALGGGILLTGFVSLLFGPPVVIAVMVLVLLWDKVAVDLSDLMGDLVTFSASLSIPNFVIIPTKLRFELQPIRAYLVDPDGKTKPDSISLIIGVGDFLFPALLTCSAYIAYSDLWPTYGALMGTLVATVVLCAELNVRDSGAPALPWVNTGAIGGFAIGMVPVVL